MKSFFLINQSAHYQLDMRKQIAEEEYFSKFLLPPLIINLVEAVVFCEGKHFLQVL